MKLIVLLLIFLPLSLSARDVTSRIGNLVIDPMVTGLDEPWSIGFLPDGRYLITERGGSLLYYDSPAQGRPVSAVPKTQQGGQAGLFDVLIPADFSSKNEIFLSYAHPSGTGTAVMRAKFDPANLSLTNHTEIFTMNSPSRGDIHFGGRLLDDGDHILLTLGERGDRDRAQNPDVDNGKIVRIKKDGSGYQRISLGHRNPQGFARGINGEIFETEHGARGGDELNIIQANGNYGWPVISYGVNYDGSKIGEGTEKAGMEQPLFYWDPSIAPSGLAIHHGTKWADAKGLIFVGSLKFDEIEILSSQNFKLIDQLKTNETARVRDIRMAPDGSIWFLSVNNGAAYRIFVKN